MALVKLKFRGRVPSSPSRVLLTTVPRDLSTAWHTRYEVPSSIRLDGGQDGFGEYSTHIEERFRTWTNQPDYGVRFLACNVLGPTYLEYPSVNELMRELRSGQFEVLCISAYTWSLPWADELRAMALSEGLVKEVWLGGYATMTSDFRNLPLFHRIFTGYSESDFAVAVGLPAVPTNSLKHPDLTTEAYFLGRHSTVGHILFERGCRKRCRYCADPVFAPGGDPALSVMAINNILDNYEKRGIKSIYISNQDTDLFSSSGKHVVESIRSRGMHFGMLTSFQRLASERFEGIQNLRNAGLSFLLLGLESLHGDALKEQRRDSAVTKHLRLMEYVLKLGITLTTTYIICFPEDTVDSIERDREVLKKELGIVVSLFNIMMPLPSTPMYIEYKEQGVIHDWDWNRWNGNHLLWKHPKISAHEAERLLGSLRATVNSPKFNPANQSVWDRRVTPAH